MADPRIPIDGVKPEPIKRKTLGFSTRTITPAVFFTGNYKSSSSAKAKELTALVQGLLANGVWESAKAAAASGVPTGTFIIVDDPKTAEQDFTVEIVPAFRRSKKEIPDFEAKA
jgi:hypothetical protein